ncbi:hypothetical protein Tco_0505139 [Tanacetum coccineum]
MSASGMIPLLSSDGSSNGGDGISGIGVDRGDSGVRDGDVLVWEKGMIWCGDEGDGYVRSVLSSLNGSISSDADTDSGESEAKMAGARAVGDASTVMVDPQLAISHRQMMRDTSVTLEQELVRVVHDQETVEQSRVPLAPSNKSPMVASHCQWIRKCSKSSVCDSKRRDSKWCFSKCYPSSMHLITLEKHALKRQHNVGEFIGTDKAKSTRKWLKPGKHEHKNGRAHKKPGGSYQGQKVNS